MGQNILIIDDDEQLREFTAELLKFDGHTIFQLADAKDLVQHARKNKVDLVLIDYHLPGIDGLMALRQLRNKHMTLPVIVMTGDVSPQLILQCFRAGADDFIIKPFDEAYLSLIINRTIDRVSISLRDTVFRMMKYTRHKDGCKRQEQDDCTCGLQEVLADAVVAARVVKAVPAG
ncbi:MAG: response regulator [Rhodospirillaceae bacterium]|nr:response regulator [Rhodospirillaceae bacterium]